NISDNSVTSGEASCAPPPTTIKIRFALPKSLAAARTLVWSIFGRRGGEGGTLVPIFPPFSPPSLAHFRAAGPGRARPTGCIRFLTVGGGFPGLVLYDGRSSHRRI